MTRPRILLVDDEPSIPASLRIALRKEPWDVAIASSGEQALEMLAKQPAEVVISDERMPAMDGATLLTEIARRWPLTIRMMLTGQAALEDAMKAVNDGGIWRFFLKPTDSADLRQSIVRALEHRALLVESKRLLDAARRQEQERNASKLEPGVGKVERDADGAIVIEPVDELDMQRLVAEMKAFADRSEARERTPAAMPPGAPRVSSGA